MLLELNSFFHMQAAGVEACYGEMRTEWENEKQKCDQCSWKIQWYQIKTDKREL